MEDSLESAVAGERVAQLIARTEQVIYYRLYNDYYVFNMYGYLILCLFCWFSLLFSCYDKEHSFVMKEED